LVFSSFSISRYIRIRIRPIIIMIEVRGSLIEAGLDPGYSIYPQMIPQVYCGYPAIIDY
jgi:hypothetical protein